MGLLLSALVTCVGVVELITFCRNVRERIAYSPAPTNLDRISDGYIRELSEIRWRIHEELQKINSETEAQPPLPTFRLNSHEDIEIEYDEDLAKSRSPSPRRFLVTEKERQSPRRFFVTEEPGLKHSKSQSSIPEFLISEEKNSPKSPAKPRYLLQERPGDAPEWPIPLPRQFIVTENELNAVIFETPDRDEEFRRSPSPYPFESPPVPRNSCSELVPVDEEQNQATYQTDFDSKVLEVNNEAALYRESANDARNLSKIERELQEALEETPAFDQDYLNNLDGVRKDKIKSSGTKKFLRRRNTGSLDSASSSKHSEDETTITKGSSNKLRSEENIGKQPEPFWVKNLE